MRTEAERRSRDTYPSITDPEVRLYHNGKQQEGRL